MLALIKIRTHLILRVLKIHHRVSSHHGVSMDPFKTVQKLLSPLVLFIRTSLLVEHIIHVEYVYDILQMYIKLGKIEKTLKSTDVQNVRSFTQPDPHPVWS